MYPMRCPLWPTERPVRFGEGMPQAQVAVTAVMWRCGPPVIDDLLLVQPVCCPSPDLGASSALPYDDF